MDRLGPLSATTSRTVHPTPPRGYTRASVLRGLEGIVCKHKDSPYRSDSRSGWIKVKTEEWKAANQYRAKLFEKS